MKKLLKNSGLSLVVLISGFNLAKAADTSDTTVNGVQSQSSPAGVTSNLPAPIAITSASSEDDSASVASSTSEDSGSVGNDTVSIGSVPSSVSIASSHPSDASSVTASEPRSDYDTDNQSVASDDSTASTSSVASDDDDFVPNINSLYGDDATEYSNQENDNFDEEAMWRDWPETDAAKEATQSEAVAPIYNFEITTSPRPSRDAVVPDIEVTSTPGKPGRFKSLAKAVAKLKSSSSYKLVPNECQCTCSNSSDQSIVNQQLPAISAIAASPSTNSTDSQGQPVAAASSKYDDVVSTADLYGDEDGN